VLDSGRQDTNRRYNACGSDERLKSLSPPRTYRPLRQIVVFLCITYGLTLAVALALPHAGIVSLITIAVPVIAVALTVAFTVPRGERRAVWAAVGFKLPRGHGLLIAVLGPAAVTALSFSIAAAFGVVRFSGLPPGFGGPLSISPLTTIIFTVVFLGEEIGWRGYLLFRVAELASGRRAAVVTGAFHAIFHLPLLLLTTTCQSAGQRWIVVPVVMLTLTAAGVWHGWLRLWVWKHLAGESFSQRLRQLDGGRRRRGDPNITGAAGLRDDRDRGGDHDHHGAARGLPADPSSRRLRQSRAEDPAADTRSHIAPRPTNADEPR
jgi:uncharacterized protein